MDQRPHLFPRETSTVKPYTYAKPVGSSEFRIPPRDRVPHSQSLVAQIESAEQQAAAQVAAKPTAEAPNGIVLEFQSDPNFELRLKSLESEGSGIELRNARVDSNGVMHAAVFIPNGKVGLFVRKFEAFADPTKDSKPKVPTKSGKPANYNLVASITQIRLAALESFWTDKGAFPSDQQTLWWEVWLREATNPHNVVDVFRQRAQAVGAMVSERSLRFPDRRVVLVRATVTQLLALRACSKSSLSYGRRRFLLANSSNFRHAIRRSSLKTHCGEFSRRHSMLLPFAIWTRESIVAISCWRWHSRKSTCWPLIQTGQPPTAIRSSMEPEWRVWRSTVA